MAALYRFDDQWSLGIVLKPRYTLDVNHTNQTSSVQTGGLGQFNFASEIRTNAELQFPTILGAGLAWRPSDAFTLSSDVTWTDWSDYIFKDEVRDPGTGLIINEKQNPITGEAMDAGKLKDTYTIRFGGEYVIIRETYLLPIRAGCGYDPAPALRNVDDFYTLSMGLGVQVDHYNFDIAWEYRWGNRVNGDIFKGINASQDSRQHRVLASLIYYF